MKRVAVIVCVLSLYGCGHSSDISSDSASSPAPSTSVPDSSGIDPNTSLGKALVQIDSPSYQDQLVFSLNDYSAVQELQKKYPEIKFTSKFGDPKKVDRERRRLERVTGKKLPDLRRHIVVAEKDKAKAKEILKKIWDEKGMEVFYPRMKARLPGINSVPDLSGQQGYINDLNIPAVWARGVKGQNINVVDDESGLNLQHEDLPRNIAGGDIGSSAFNKAHGTAVMGILVGMENGHGITGIVPQSSPIAASSGGANAIGSLANGIEADQPKTHIYLLEETYSRPGSDPTHCTADDPTDCVSAEYYLDAFEAFQIATAFGTTVVLPAGNGIVNMDTTSNADGWPDLRFRREDSGAIMVGASLGSSHQKADWSNCGQRTDLFSWGQGVVTTSYPGAGASFDWTGSGNPNTSDPNTYFTNQFGGTSSAAAIIAGSTALLQSYAVQQMGSAYKQLTPLKIREILVNSGISAQNERGCSIGKQPRMDVAMRLFDDLWAQVQRDFSEIRNRQEISGSRRQTLRDRGIQLLCNYHRPDLSDVNCPETARCVLLPSSVERTPGHPTDPNACQGAGFPACIDIDYAQSDYDCAAGAIWPRGVEIAKPLDFDGDKRADLVSWTRNGWKIDLSSRGDGGMNLGRWDLQFNIPMTMGRWVWPVAEDYNSDGRTDLAVWDKEHGVWYIAFTNNALLNGTWHGWDWQVTLPYRDELNRDVWQAKYSRPVPGDYNGDGYVDLALARSDGIWSIDFGGPDRSNYGSFDQNPHYLTDQQLNEAPGWAYLPVEGRHAEWVGDGYRYIQFKIPDGVTGAGSIVGVFRSGTIADTTPPLFGGNEIIPLQGFYTGQYDVKYTNGQWKQGTSVTGDWILETPLPNNVFGGNECHPFLTDCDNDDIDDRSVQCPTEFRIALSSTGEVLHVPLGYNTNEFTLPGKPYYGGISYSDVMRNIQWQLNSSSAAPIIPVDMVQTSSQP
ncbi:MAG: S8 family serine peptidase [Deltaproteobacteria bacterium]|nr:S8 family serine peptidase [Deltaproteobacteria bacterium]